MAPLKFYDGNCCKPATLGRCLPLLLRKQVLRISRYSGFLWVVPTNTGIFLRGLKLYGENRT